MSSRRDPRHTSVIHYMHPSREAGFSGEQPIAKLAFWNIVNDVHRSVFSHPLTALRAGWVSLVLNTLAVSLRDRRNP